MCVTCTLILYSPNKFTFAMYLTLKCLELGGSYHLAKYFAEMEGNSRALALFIYDYNQMLLQLRIAIPRVLMFNDHLKHNGFH